MDRLPFCSTIFNVPQLPMKIEDLLKNGHSRKTSRSNDRNFFCSFTNCYEFFWFAILKADDLVRYYFVNEILNEVEVCVKRPSRDVLNCRIVFSDGIKNYISNLCFVICTYQRVTVGKNKLPLKMKTSHKSSLATSYMYY